MNDRGLSVIIPSRNPVNLRACVARVRRYEPAAHVIAIDDGLPIADYGVDDLLFGDKPFCFARNVNLGIQTAQSDDVVLLNDDALLETPGGFTAMRAWSDAHPQFGVISAAADRANMTLPLAVAFVCVLIPHRVIQAVGLLDERFTGQIDGELVYGGENDDYCYRVRQAGLDIAIFGGCRVDHSQLVSTFRPHGGGLSIAATRKRFREIHGFEMGTQ